MTEKAASNGTRKKPTVVLCCWNRATSADHDIKNNRLVLDYH